jgi:hypothetical protein
VSPSSQPAGTSRDEAARRALFDAEVLAADLTLSDDDRARLFEMWADHLPSRDSLRAAAPDLPEEPSFIEKSSQLGAGVTGQVASSGSAGGGA